MRHPNPIHRGGISWTLPALFTLLLFFGSGVPARAQSVQSVTLSASSGLFASPGDTVTVRVDLLDVVGVTELSTVKVALVADPLVLRPVDAAPGAALAAWPAADFQYTLGGDRVEVVAVTQPAATVSAGEFLLFRFVVADDAVDGETSVLDISGVDPEQAPILLVDPGAPGAGVKVAQQDGDFIVTGGLTCLPGDANPDGAVDAGDAIVVLRITAGLLSQPTGPQRCGADADLDGDIDTGDAVWVLRETVGLGHAAATVSSPVARLSSENGRLSLVVDDASSVYGLQLALRERGGVQWRPMNAPNRGLRVDAEVEGLRRVVWAGAEALGTGDRLVLELPAVGAGEIEIESLEFFDAGGATLRSEVERARADFAEGEPLPRAGAVRMGNHPNPFNPTTTVHFDLPRAARVRVTIYDAAGKRVRTLLDEARPAGPGSVVWNGTDAAGHGVASGVYYARLYSDAGGASHRLLLVK